MDSFEKKGKLCCPQSERSWILAGGGDNVLRYLPYDGYDNEQIYAYENYYVHLHNGNYAGTFLSVCLQRRMF